jgi:hypothetical protein
MVALGQQCLSSEGKHKCMGQEHPDGTSHAQAKAIMAMTPQTPREPWLVLAPKNELAMEAAASTVPARARSPVMARSCSASALAVNSKLNCSIDSAIPRFYRSTGTALVAARE